MKTKVSIFIFCLLVLLIPFISFANSSLAERLSGRILLQVEEKGEAYYINPVDLKIHFLGRPEDAFSVMKELGLGVSEKDFNSFKIKTPRRLSGRILLRVEANGEAYYINPVDLKMYFLDRPADAFVIMRNLGLGITNNDLNKISYNSNYFFSNTQINSLNNNDFDLTSSHNNFNINSDFCVIKGNISYKTGEKIYHLPGCPNYKSTKIDTRYGERWFCTEEEAVKAGWRKAYNCR